MQNGIFLFLIKNKVSKKRSILDPLQDKKKLADPDPITCDPGSRVHDPDPEAVIPDPIYLVTTLLYTGIRSLQHNRNKHAPI